MTSDTSELELEFSLDDILMDRDMKRLRGIEELIEHFMLIDEDKDVLENKTGATLLGCVLSLKYFEYEVRFPSAKHEILKAVVDYVARQLKVDADLFARYDREERTIKLHRTQLREHLKFREATAEDSAKIASWLIAMPFSTDQNPNHMKASVLPRLREEQIEPPTTRHFKSPAAQQVLDRETLQKRLLLYLYRMGTNTGIKRVSMGDHGQTYQELLTTRRRYPHQEYLRAAIVEIANTIFQVSPQYIWGEGTTTCLDEQELAALSLHLLQICLVYVNTLLIQQVLTDPKHLQQMKKEDLRARTPLIYTHTTPTERFD